MKISSFEKGVPIPEIMPRNNKYNLHLMKVGENFTVEYWDSDDIQKLRVALSNYARRNKKKFITRKIEEEGDYKLRVWREF
jgi:hypothetical protein|tara:strand:+ start:3481 stop:3723 length:243 start_codon:yes stop_codon:yes gene_type:complete